MARWRPLCHIAEQDAYNGSPVALRHCHWLRPCRSSHELAQHPLGARVATEARRWPGGLDSYWGVGRKAGLGGVERFGVRTGEAREVCRRAGRWVMGVSVSGLARSFRSLPDRGHAARRIPHVMFRSYLEASFRGATRIVVGVARRWGPRNWPPANVVAPMQALASADRATGLGSDGAATK